MNFDKLDKQMRVFEVSHDHRVLPGIHMIARLDGHNFTRLTKELHQFEMPFDVRFHEYMLETTQHLMTCGFSVLYGYTQSDEISLLFHLDEQALGRNLRKYHSILAGQASAKFSLLLGDVVSFDCRICQLPGIPFVLDYFRWRQEDAHRNALNAHCYWLLRKQGQSATQVTNALLKLTVSAKNELLYSNLINFNNLPNWQKRGSGLYWENHEKIGTNPQNGETVVTTRRHIKRDDDLPLKEDYALFIAALVSGEPISGSLSDDN